MKVQNIAHGIGAQRPTAAAQAGAITGSPQLNFCDNYVSNVLDILLTLVILCIHKRTGLRLGKPNYFYFTVIIPDISK